MKTHNNKGGDSVPTIGILVKRFPKLSETFILGELLGLEQAGFQLRIYSLYPPSDQTVHPYCEKLQAPIVYCPSEKNDFISSIVGIHLAACLRNPVRYIRALFCGSGKHNIGVNGFTKSVWLAKEMLKNNVRHLHTHFINEPASVALCAHHLTGLPFSLSAHAKDIYLSENKDLANKIRAARFTVTCTEYNRDYLQSLVPGKYSVHRMYHGVDFDCLQCDKEKKSVDTSTVLNDAPVILSIGRLREKKGFQLLIEACRQLKESGVQFCCKIVGYGPDHEKLEKQIEQAGLQEFVFLLGKLNHPEVIKLFREASLFVLPCIIGSDGDRDGIPNVILEALAMKVPVVTTAISGIPEIIKHRETGLLVEQGDVEILTSNIEELLNDDELREQIQDNGYKTVRQQFCNESNLKLLQQLLEKSVSGESMPGKESKTEPETELGLS